MANNQETDCKTAPYGYYRSSDGCDDIFFIEDTRDGEIVMGIYFWDEPDTNEAAEAEAKAQLVVQALNMQGGWINQYHVTRCTLKAHKEIATIWSVWDLLHIRPDLSEDQAWKVLQQVDGCRGRKRGITLYKLRITASQMFPRNSRKTAIRAG
jgi:hypothetical protein